MKNYLEALEKQIKKSNPNFTEYSLRRTIEAIINIEDKHSFMHLVHSKVIDRVISMIPSNWNIQGRVRKDYAK